MPNYETAYRMIRGNDRKMIKEAINIFYDLCLVDDYNANEYYFNIAYGYYRLGDYDSVKQLRYLCDRTQWNLLSQAMVVNAVNDKALYTKFMKFSAFGLLFGSALSLIQYKVQV